MRIGSDRSSIRTATTVVTLLIMVVGTLPAYGQSRDFLPSCEDLEVSPSKSSVDALKDVRDILERGEVLQSALVIGSFTELLIGPDPGDVVDIVTRDWEMFKEAVTSADRFVRRQAQAVAGLEMLNHAGGPELRFWQCMYRALEP